MRICIGPMLLAVSSLVMAQESTIVTTDKQGELVTNVSVTLRAPPAAVFRALTSCEAIKQWMQPERMTLSECQADARVGGTLKLVFLASKDRRIQVTDTYRELVAPRLIRYDETYDFSPLTIDVTATLEEVAGGTLFKEKLLYRSAQERDTDFPGIASSVQQAYVRLNLYLQGATSAPTPSASR